MPPIEASRRETGARSGALPPLPSLDQPGNLDDSDSGANSYLRGGIGGRTLWDNEMGVGLRYKLN